MDYHLPGVSDDGELSWSDSRSIGSDDAQSLMLAESPPEWIDQLAQAHDLPAIVVPALASNQLPHTGQLSPVSNRMAFHGHVNDDGGFVEVASRRSPAVMVHSGSVSSTDSWSMDYVDSDDTGAADNTGMEAEYQWEQGSDDVLTVPKLEPLDEDDVRLDDVKEAPSALAADDGAIAGPGKVKRPRGRPRKHPLTPLVTAKITKGRSKTGCLTCRKRKKKCDEAKPRCMNCEKNSVFCEGYPEKQIWKSGKERAEEERLKAQSLPVITMQPIFHGLETTEDRIFWKHYNEHVSGVFTVEGDHKNAFKDMIIPIAVKHQGLMHSILSLSSKHIDYDTPYGVNILRTNPSTTRESLQERSEFHHESAFQKLRENFARHVEKSSPEYKDNLLGRYGQMLCLILESMVEGNPEPYHRLHLKAYQTMIQECPPEDPAFLAFISEFFQYHIYADELLRLDDPHTSRQDLHNCTATIPIHPPRLLGVADGLFGLMSQITSIRHTIRSNITNRVDPVVDYTSLYQADGIYAAIQSWTPHFPPGDSRALVGLLYKQMMWIYLFRTVYPPSLSPASSSASLPLHSVPPSGGLSAAVVNTPPQSVASSCTSSPTLPASASNTINACFNLPDPGSSQPSLKSYPAIASAQHLGASVSSPEPIRQPLGHDPRITLAVEESLSILESFKPSDPSQTLLLIPCLIIGSACFSPAQQDRIRAVVRTVRGYTGLRNADCVAEVLEEVWRLMDVGDCGAVWDWQRVAKGLKLEFLI